MKKMQKYTIFTLFITIFFLSMVIGTAQGEEITWNFQADDTFNFDFFDYTEEIKKEGTISIEILAYHENGGDSDEYGVEFNMTTTETITEYLGEQKESDPLVSSDIYFTKSQEILSIFLASQNYLDENLTTAKINQTIYVQKLWWGLELCGYGPGCYTEEFWEQIEEQLENFDIETKIYDYGYEMSFSGEDLNHVQRDFREELRFDSSGILQIYHYIHDLEEYKVSIQKNNIPAFQPNLLLFASLLGISIGIVTLNKRRH